MQPDVQLAAQFLSLVGLMAGTIEYCEIVRRRQTARAAATLAAEAKASGLAGLVRIFAADDH